jgi:DNA-binding MarR family transcriptional regulator
MADNQSLRPTPDDLKLGEELRRTIGKFVRSVRRQADTPTSSQSETLGLLDRQGPLSVADLAFHRKVKHQSMRLVVAQMEANGLVEKKQNPADGRSHLLFLSAKGQRTLARSRKARQLQIATLIDERLSDADRQTLRAAITVIERLT